MKMRLNSIYSAFVKGFVETFKLLNPLSNTQAYHLFIIKFTCHLTVSRKHSFCYRPDPTDKARWLPFFINVDKIANLSKNSNCTKLT